MRLEIPLTQGKVALVDAADYERLSAHNWHAVRTCTRHRVNWYASRTGRVAGEPQTVYMHREVLNPPKGVLVDHADRNGLHNWRDNLRVASCLQNIVNSKRPNKSGYRGVYWDEDKQLFYVQIKLDGRKRSLGYFRDPIEAALRYDAVNFAAYGEYASLNFPDKRPLFDTEAA